MLDAAARARWDDVGKLILRLTVAFLMVFHGIGKVQRGIGWMEGLLSQHYLPFFVGYGVYIAEVAAPILLIVGIFTRPAAAVIAFDMIMAMILAVKGRVFTISERSGALGGEIELFYLFTSLAIVFLGSGRYAVSRGAGRFD